MHSESSLMSWTALDIGPEKTFPSLSHRKQKERERKNERERKRERERTGNGKEENREREGDEVFIDSDQYECLLFSLFLLFISFLIEEGRERKREKEREGKKERERKRGKERERKKERKEEKGVRWPVRKEQILASVSQVTDRRMTLLFLLSFFLSLFPIRLNEQKKK